MLAVSDFSNLSILVWVLVCCAHTWQKKTFLPNAVIVVMSVICGLFGIAMCKLSKHCCQSSLFIGIDNISFDIKRVLFVGGKHYYGGPDLSNKAREPWALPIQTPAWPGISFTTPVACTVAVSPLPMACGWISEEFIDHGQCLAKNSRFSHWFSARA